MARTLQTADVRREDLLEAAVEQFAAKGYYGTPTTEIAKAAGISQAYLFRLFPTKQELFIAVVERCMENVRARFEHAGAPFAGDVDAALDAMGEAYSELLADRTMLLNQLHSYAASDDPVVREAVQRQFGRIVDTVRTVSGAPDDRAARFIATGMFMTVMAAMQADALDQPWAHSLMAGIYSEESC